MTRRRCDGIIVKNIQESDYVIMETEKIIDETSENTAVHTTLSGARVRTYDVCSEPFRVYGLMKPDECENRFRRIPGEVAKNVNKDVFLMYSNSAGGRVRFSTDSAYVAVRCELANPLKFAQFAPTGCAGFDLYATEDGGEHYLGTVLPPFNVTEGYENELFLKEGRMRDFTLNLPLYSDLISLKILLEEGAEERRCRDYKYEVPVVYYGSSITQGGFVSRPGNAYSGTISRMLDCNFVNLGFAGSALGETSIAEYIAGLDMSVFVYDYDYNAPTPEHLAATHYPMYKKIREKQPELPIICVSRPNYYSDVADSEARRQIIIETVRQAEAEGDRNIYFVDGREFGEEFGMSEDMTVDGVHPNDFGHFCMARAIGEIIKKVTK